jgi:hypothetical protein
LHRTADDFLRSLFEGEITPGTQCTFFVSMVRYAEERASDATKMKMKKVRRDLHFIHA